MKSGFAKRAMRFTALVGVLGAVAFGAWRWSDHEVLPQAEWLLEAEVRLPTSSHHYQDLDLLRYANQVMARLLRAREDDAPVALALILDGGLLFGTTVEEGVVINVPRSKLAACNSEDELAGMLAWHFLWAITPRAAPPNMLRAPPEDFQHLMAEFNEQMTVVRHDVDERMIRWIEEAGFSAGAAATMCGHPLLSPGIRSYDDETQAEVIATWREELLQRQNFGTEGSKSGVTPRARRAFLRRLEGLEYGRSLSLGTYRGSSFFDVEADIVFELIGGFEFEVPMPHSTPQKVDLEFQTAEDGLRSGTNGDLLYSRVARAQDLAEHLEGQMDFEGHFFGEDFEWELISQGKGESHGVPFGYVHFTKRADMFEPQESVIVQYDLGEGKVARLTLSAREENVGPSIREDWLDVIHGLRRVTTDDREHLRPRRITLHEVAQGESVSDLASLMVPSWDREAEFRLLNGLYPDGEIEVGQLVKIVVEAE